MALRYYYVVNLLFTDSNDAAGMGLMMVLTREERKKIIKNPIKENIMSRKEI